MITAITLDGRLVKVTTKDPTKALRHAWQTAERRTVDTGRPWHVVEDRARGPHVSPYRVRPEADLTPDDVVVLRPSAV